MGHHLVGRERIIWSLQPASAMLTGKGDAVVGGAASVGGKGGDCLELPLRASPAVWGA